MPRTTRSVPNLDVRVERKRRRVVINLDSDALASEEEPLRPDRSLGQEKQRPQPPKPKRAISSITAKTTVFRLPSQSGSTQSGFTQSGFTQSGSTQSGSTRSGCTQPGIDAVVLTPLSQSLEQRRRRLHPESPSGSTLPPIGALWVDKYEPKEPLEVAIHARKLRDVERALGLIGSGPGQGRILLLTGPSGASKSTVVKTLLNGMARPQTLLSYGRQTHGSGGLRPIAYGSSRGQAYVEYTNPELHNTSHVGAFSLFLEAARYSTLPILVEELPNVYHEETRQRFLQSLSEWLHYAGALPPLILCLTETELPPDSDSSTRYFLNLETSLTAETLLGPAILHHPRLERIKFNPIAKTILIKALRRIVLIESSVGALVGVKRAAVEAVLHKLADSGMGDIRSAISALEFWAIPGMGAVALESLTRESHLGLFHAVGKILYGSSRENLLKDSILPSGRGSLRSLVGRRTNRLVAEGLGGGFVGGISSGMDSETDVSDEGSTVGLDPEHYVVPYVLDRYNSPSVLLLSVLENYTAVLADLAVSPLERLKRASVVAGHLSLGNTMVGEAAIEVALRGSRQGLKGLSASARAHTLKFSRFFRVMKQYHATKRELAWVRERRNLAVGIADLNMLTGFYEPLIVNAKRYPRVKGDRCPSRFGGEFTTILLETALPYGESLAFAAERSLGAGAGEGFEPSASEMSDPIVESDDDFDDDFNDSLDEGFEVLLSQRPVTATATPKIEGVIGTGEWEGELSSDSDLDGYF